MYPGMVNPNRVCLDIANAKKKMFKMLVKEYFEILIFPKRHIYWYVAKTVK